MVNAARSGPGIKDTGARNSIPRRSQPFTVHVMILISEFDEISPLTPVYQFHLACEPYATHLTRNTTAASMLRPQPRSPQGDPRDKTSGHEKAPALRSAAKHHRNPPGLNPLSRVVPIVVSVVCLAATKQTTQPKRKRKPILKIIFGRQIPLSAQLQLPPATPDCGTDAEDAAIRPLQPRSTLSAG